MKWYDYMALAGSFMYNAITILFVFALVLTLFIGVLALEGWLLSIIWNWVAVQVFGVGTITWLQGVGLILLKWLLLSKLIDLNYNGKNKRK